MDSAFKQRILGAGLLAALPFSAQAADDTYFEMAGKLSGELRYFTQEEQFAGQDQSSTPSLAAEPEFYWEWNRGDDILTFIPFVRIDQQDHERTHGDIRELSWIHVGRDWEVRSGLRKVFWGVTEFQHLVDVINQTDGVEDFDGEDKLGQPMVNLSLVRNWGIVDLFLLPGFRERTFPGESGRLRSGLVVDTDRAEYESSAKETHTDAAVRWSQSMGVFDLGAYWFHGTNRDPQLQPRSVNGETVLVPFYEQMDQFGFDMQATIGSWLWKLETIYRDSRSDSYQALQGGFEYSFYGIQGGRSDLGVLLEYGWDERGEEAQAPVQNDLFLGSRLTLNDMAGSQLLAGISYDPDFDSSSLLIEASRRYGNNWKFSIDGRFFSSDEQGDMIFSLRQDDHIQLNMEHYF